MYNAHVLWNTELEKDEGLDHVTDPGASDERGTDIEYKFDPSDLSYESSANLINSLNTYNSS
jgi:hypothetical protein